MLLHRILFACAAGLMLVGQAASDPVRKVAGTSRDTGPMFVVQVQSIDGVIGRVKATVKSFVTDDIYKEFEQHVLSEIDTRKLAGVDTKRPAGAYANLDAGILQSDFSKSQAVVMVPVSGEKDFLSLLEKAGIKSTEQKDEGLYALEMPNFPLNVFLRFSKQYAYISLGTSGALDAKQLPEPESVLAANESAAFVLRAHIDRVPKELKDAALQLIDQSMAMFKDLPAPEPVKEALDHYAKMVQRMYKMGLEGGRLMTYRIDLEPKVGLTLDQSLTAKPQSKLAEAIAGIKPNENLLGGLATRDSAAHALFSLPLYIPEMQELLTSLVEAGAKASQADFERSKAPQEAQDVAAAGFEALRRTIKSGRFDLAASLRGPSKEGHFAAVGALTLKETAPLEKAIKEAVKLIPPQAAGFLKLDAHKVGDHSVHELAVGDMLPQEAQRVFGKASVYVAFAGDRVCVSFGTNGLDLIKEALDAQATRAPVLTVEAAGKRVAELVKKAAEKEKIGRQEQMIFDLIGKQDRLVLFSVDVQGGQELHVKANYGVVPFAMLFMIGRTASATFQQVAPPAAVPAVKKP